MKKIILLLILGLSFLDINSKENKQVSLCLDLCLFFVSEKIISEEDIKAFEDDYCSLIMIWDALEKNNYPSLPDLDKEFGVYKFDYAGREAEDATYILIKNKENYKIFLSSKISSIINELLRIKEERVGLMNEKLFDEYLKAINGFVEELSVSFKIGSNLEYVITK